MNDQTKIDPATGRGLATVEVKKIGNSSGLISSGLIFPKDLLSRLNLKVGDQLYATLTPDAGVRFMPSDPDFDKAMEVARRSMKGYHNALTEFAK
jgi:putative addiction module antidote